MSDFVRAVVAFMVALFVLVQLTDWLEAWGRAEAARLGCLGHGENRAVRCLIDHWRGP